MEPTENTVTLDREALSKALMELARQEVCVSLMVDHCVDQMQTLSNALEALLSDHAREQGQNLLFQTLMSHKEWAEQITDAQVEQWEMDCLIRYFPE